MGAYLVDNRPARSQWRNPRREKPSGVIVLHSAENVPDVNPPDTGAENVAHFILNRADPGSYHDLFDSDTYISLVPWSFEAFHDATGTNPHSIGLSAAWQAHQLPALLRDHPRWVEATVIRMARRAAEAAEWLRVTYGVIVPASRVAVDKARARVPGFLSHAELDPARRTDPGAAFPWDLFLRAFRQFTISPATEPPEADPMAGITLDQIGLKVIQAVGWTIQHDEPTRDAIRSLGLTPDAVGLKVIQAVRWCAREDDEFRSDIKALVAEALAEQEAA